MRGLARIQDSKRFTLVAVLMAGTAGLVAVATLWMLYVTAFEQVGDRLRDTVRTQAAIMQSIADTEEAKGPEDRYEYLLRHLARASDFLTRFGKTGELNLARLDGDDMVYLLPRRHDRNAARSRLPFHTHATTPMAQALRGAQGVLVGEDDRGVEVLAAYQPIPSLGLGVVAKLDLSEVRQPFIETGLLVLGLGLAAVLVSVLAFVLLTRPLYRQIVDGSARLRAVVETAADGILTIDPSGRMLSANSAAERIFGYTAAELLGRNVNRLMPSPDRERHDDYIRHYLETGEKKIIGIGREVRGRRKDGSTFPLLLSVSEVRVGGTHQFTGIVHDLTDWHRMMAENEARVRAIVETAVDAIVTIDARGHVLSANSATERMFGYTADEIIGRNVNRLMPSPDRERHDGYLANYLATGEKKIIGVGREVRGRRKDGSTFPLLLGVSEVRVGNERYFAGILHDLTERERLEQQVRAAHSLTTLGMIARGVAHQFNNTFQIIQGYLEILNLEGDGSPRFQRAVSQIQRGLERCTTLTRHLRAFSTGRPASVIAVQVAPLLRELATLLEPTLSSHVQLMLDDEDAGQQVLADPRGLSNALLQIGLFAGSAAGGSGVLTLSTGPAAGDEATARARVAIRVHTSGTLPQADGVDDPATLFAADAPPARGMEQERLGLLIATRIVRDMHGDLAVHRGPDSGTTFVVTLPAPSDRPEAPDAHSGIGKPVA